MVYCQCMHFTHQDKFLVSVKSFLAINLFLILVSEVDYLV